MALLVIIAIWRFFPPPLARRRARISLGLRTLIVLLLSAVSVIYWLAPAAENQFKWITPGAALFAVVWLAFSIGFSFYFLLGVYHVYLQAMAWSRTLAGG